MKPSNRPREGLVGRSSKPSIAPEDTITLKGLNERLRFLKYSQPGDFFYPHTDGYFPRTINERSFVTVLLYLNEGYRGACTTIYDVMGRPLPVAPRTGMALVHDHLVYHEVPPLREGVKHVIRTDVMYERV